MKNLMIVIWQRKLHIDYIMRYILSRYVKKPILLFYICVFLFKVKIN